MPEGDDQPRQPRGFWSGTIAFGLVSVPVSLFVATRSSRVSLRMVDEEGTPLRRVYFCSREEQPLERDDIVRGYEVEKDRYVVVEDEELEAIAPEKSQEINLERFVDAAHIDPAYFERAYFLAPGRGGTRPYRLLAQAMEESGRAGIATFVIRGKEYLVAIIAEKGLLRAETLRFHDELRTPGDIGLPQLDESDDARAKAMEKAIRKLHADRLDKDALSDRQTPRLEKVVRRKLKGGEDVVRAAETAEPSEQESAEVIDLMQVLKQSVKESRSESSASGGESRKPRPKRKSPQSASRREALDGRTRDELYKHAQHLNIAGRSNMSKDELIEAIRNAG